jgi:dUTP pyrophosphatase
MEMLFKGTAPARAYHDDAGLDLFVHGGDWTIEPGQTIEIPLGVAIKSPPGTWTLLTGRSSTWRNRRLMVGQGVIDEGFVGPLFAVVHNFGDQTQHVKEGERIAQLIVLPNLTAQIELTETNELPQTARGAAGFGSSGQ